ncbi:MAG: hypothetical protein HC892_14605 [Saprospiraceae bacterium]|nr:hypothetical protein [Saprospiraceae bacterium]
MIKQIVLLVLCSFLMLLSAYGQDTQKKLKEWTQMYQLTETQQIKLNQLLELEQENLLELQSVRASNLKLYEQKQRNLIFQTQQGLKSMLNASQLLIFNQQEKAVKDAKKQQYQQLKAAGASKEELSKLLEEMKQ